VVEDISSITIFKKFWVILLTGWPRLFMRADSNNWKEFTGSDNGRCIDFHGCTLNLSDDYYQGAP
jgi:hypothetical protein